MFLVQVIGSYNEVEDSETFGRLTDALQFMKGEIERGKSTDNLKLLEELEVEFIIDVKVKEK